MKARTAHRLVSLIVWTSGLVAYDSSHSLEAADLYWNPGGDGIWGTGPGDKNWNLVPGAPTGNTTWSDGIDDVAVFQDATGGVVTVFDTVQTAGIVQTGAGYTVNAGNIVLVPDSALNAPFVNVQAGVLAIDSQLEGSAGMVKTGSATLLLSATNSYTGHTGIQGGTLNLAGALASTEFTISGGASLLNQNGGLSAGATLTNSGSLTLNADDTITSYISNGGTLTAGPGTLFNTSTTLNDGSTVAGLLNAGTLTSNGAVLLSGTATAGSASVQTGALSLTGTLAGDTVNISGGASLLNQNGGLSAARRSPTPARSR
jgi:autotransporter-associated beta strand protein